MAKRKQPEVKTLGRKLRPSNADRYLHCPASVVASADLPDGESTIYADKGTVVHAVIENCINTGRDPKSYLGEIVCEVEIPVDEEMVQSANFCLDYIKSQGFTDIQAEQVVELPWIKNPDGELTTGKVDFVGYDSDFDVLKVGDYKNGFQPVDPRSYQFAMYLLALIEKYPNLNKASSVLVQPNSSLGPTTVESEWTKSELQAVEELAHMATDYVTRTKPEDIELDDYCEGSWCKFCPLASGAKMCPKKSAALFDDPIGQEVVKVAKKPLPTPTGMTREQRALVLGKRKEIKKWLDEVYDIELELAKIGDVPPGMKLIEGRSATRSWLKGLDEGDISTALYQAGIEETYDQKLITPATAKKLLKGKLPPELDALMTPEGKSIELVPADSGEELFD